MYVLGIDVGTSGCKASVIDGDGAVRGKAYCEYFLTKPRPEWEEIDPHTVWDAVRSVVAQSIRTAGGVPVAGISVSSFGETVVPVAADGTPLYNGIVYIDPRGQQEAAQLAERLGQERVNRITGATAHSMYSLPKIMWLREHEPDVYNRTWKFLLFADYILFRLGAKPHTDYTLATRTMAFDIVKKEWSREILDAAGVSADKFAEPVQSGTAVGRIDPAIAAALGINPDALLVAGGHDQPCAALGAGAIRPGLAIDGLGTTECVCPSFTEPVFGGRMTRSGFACVPHVRAGQYVTYAFTFTSGSMLKWYRDRIQPSIKLDAETTGINAYDLIIERATPTPSPVLLLPHFAGAATPYMDNDAVGAMVGLNINTTRADIAKAILEGITFEMMVNMDRLEAAGIQVDELRAVGGLAKSEPFLQLKSDMMGRRIVTLEVTEAGTLGVAMLAGAAAGLYRSLDDAAARLVRVRRAFTPNPAVHAAYRERYALYQRMYGAVRDIYARPDGN